MFALFGDEFMCNAARQALEKGIGVLNLGQTGRGQARYDVVKPEEGWEQVGIFEPPYDQRRRYRSNLLDSFWDQQRPELGGSSLREEVAKRGGLATSMWGADDCGLNANGEFTCGWNYMAVAKSTSRLPKWTARLNPRDRHLATGGACRLRHQPPEQLVWIRWHVEPEGWRQIATVVPTGDYLLSKLTGQKVHQAGMLQAQGLGLPGAPVAVERWVKLPKGTICPWRTLARDQLVMGPDNVPCTGVLHDTECAWIPLLSQASYGLSTGSWLIAATQLDGFPTDDLSALFDAGVCVEGNPPNLSLNIEMFGPTMDVALRSMQQETGTSTEDTEFMLAQTGLPPLPSDIPWQEDPTAAAARVYNLVTQGQRSWKMAVATLRHSVAQAAARDLRVLSKSSGKALDKVAVAGGWTKSPAFIRLLKKYGDFEVVLPPYAERGTNAGAVAILLFAIAKAAGEPITMAEALGMLPA